MFSVYGDQLEQCIENMRYISGLWNAEVNRMDGVIRELSSLSDMETVIGQLKKVYGDAQIQGQYVHDLLHAMEQIQVRYVKTEYLICDNADGVIVAGKKSAMTYGNIFYQTNITRVKISI